MNLLDKESFKSFVRTPMYFDFQTTLHDFLYQAEKIEYLGPSVAQAAVSASQHSSMKRM